MLSQMAGKKYYLIVYIIWTFAQFPRASFSAAIPHDFDDVRIFSLCKYNTPNNTGRYHENYEELSDGLSNNCPFLASVCANNTYQNLDRVALETAKVLVFRGKTFPCLHRRSHQSWGYSHFDNILQDPCLENYQFDCKTEDWWMRSPQV